MLEIKICNRGEETQHQYFPLHEFLSFMRMDHPHPHLVELGRYQDLPNNV